MFSLLHDKFLYVTDQLQTYLKAQFDSRVLMASQKKQMASPKKE